MKSINDLMFANAVNAGGDMATKIEDGLGSGREASVNPANELNVTIGTAFERASRRGDAYLWFTSDANLADADTVLMIRNDSSTQDLVIDSVEILNGDATTCIYDFHIVTAQYTAAGTAIVGTNMNTNFANTASVTAIHDETGNTQGTVIKEYIALLADTYYDFTDMGIILKEGTSFGVDQITASDSGAVSIKAYFIDK